MSNDSYLTALYADDDRWRTLAPRTSPCRGNYRIRTDRAAVRIESGDSIVLVDPGPDCRLARHISLIILTHAHHDHIGGLITVAEANPHAPIILTPGTLALIEATDKTLMRALIAERGLLRDSDGTPMRTVGITVRLHPAGHLLGAAMADIQFERCRILVTGDFTLRSIAGLPGAVLPDDAYDAVVMECTHAWNADAPSMNQSADMQGLVDLTKESLKTKHAVIIEADALGKAQDAYFALASAVMRGELRINQIGLTRSAYDVAQLYAREPSPRNSPWRIPLERIEANEHMPDGTVVISPARPNAAWPESIAVLRPSGSDYIRTGEYVQSIHASWRELFVTALAIQCNRAVLYHGPVHKPEIQTLLVQELIRTGRDVTSVEAT